MSVEFSNDYSVSANMTKVNIVKQLKKAYQYYMLNSFDQSILLIVRSIVSGPIIPVKVHKEEKTLVPIPKPVLTSSIHKSDMSVNKNTSQRKSTLFHTVNYCLSRIISKQMLQIQCQRLRVTLLWKQYNLIFSMNLHMTDISKLSVKLMTLSLNLTMNLNNLLCGLIQKVTWNAPKLWIVIVTSL